MGSVSNRVDRFLGRTVRAIGPNAELAISILFLAFCAVATGATLYLIWTAVRILVSLVW